MLPSSFSTVSRSYVEALRVSTSEPQAPTPAPPVRGTRPRRRALAALGVVLAVAVVLALALGTGVFRSSTGPSPPRTTAAFATYEQAEGVAQTAVSGTSGGPWSPILGIGLASATSASVPGGNVTGLSSLTECDVAWSGGTAPLVEIASTPGSASPGTAAFWIVGFVNGSSVLRLATVSLGNASVLATVSGTECTGLFALTDPLSNSVVVDSPVVADNTSRAGGSAWLADHPDALQTWEILPGGSEGGLSVPPTWHSAYTTCSLVPASGSIGDQFTANLTAATGYVLATHNGSGSCTESGSVGLVATAGAPGPFANLFNRLPAGAPARRG